jgi:glycosyltransferase involved in cell wall biosynthesis
MKLKIEYIARWNPAASSGVVNKIRDAVLALNEVGFDAVSNIVEYDGLKGHFFFMKAVFESNASILILRSTSYSMILVFWAMLWQRMMGKKVVVDVPTPFSAVIREIEVCNASVGQKLVLKALVYLNFPWALMIANRIAHYAEESKWFSMGIKGKILMTGNGVDVRKFSIVNGVNGKCFNKLRIIGVAAVEDWHGFDMVISGIQNYTNAKNRLCGDIVDIHFDIVGDGGAIPRLREMVKVFGLEEKITFHGPRYGAKLDALCESADVAVSSLGIHRKGLRSASSLKTREYMSRGIPFIQSGIDYDMPSMCEYIYQKPADETALDIEDVVLWWQAIAPKCVDVSILMRKYAEDNLDYRAKVGKLVAGL